MPRIIPLVVLIAALLAACAPRPFWSATFRTSAGQEIRNIRASSATFHTEWSWVSEKKTINESGMRDPIPDTVLISWDSLDGSHHEKAVAVGTRLPKEFNASRDGVIFHIDDRADEVRLYFQVWYEQYRSKEIAAQ